MTQQNFTGNSNNADGYTGTAAAIPVNQTSQVTTPLSPTGTLRLRIALRWQVLEEEHKQMALAKKNNRIYVPEVQPNGDTLKQLLVRSHYMLFKHPRLWSREQKQRADLLFTRYPLLYKGYVLANRLGELYRCCKSKEEAFKKLTLRYNDVEASGIDSFRTVARAIQLHYLDILNFFISRSTNASAESLNAKVKSFRATSGVSEM